ncbi:MAG: hypothetical protein K9N47_09395 [Prosthecobacter sp.]|uniref:hypothetical protein n=1 Tax=Prosthecobacter sp. TaxID=1965333 RepID=UPI0025D6BA59|nr:hypothetical protein [Prosthecobacter sp.]MCF7786326.1 hypothetical protein [Prosthecobacter sp.]
MKAALVQFALILTAVSACCGQSVGAWPEKPVPSTSKQIAILEDKRLNESSGLALGVRDPSIFWTMNDSGGEPCVFAIDRSGKTRAKVRVRDAANFDWEDIASGKDEKGTPTLFIGDIGDNLFLRASIQVYQIPEPEIKAAGQPVAETETATPQIWRAYYPDGRRNAESLLVHPLTRRLYILTKSDDGKCALYAFPQLLQPKVSMVLEKVADLAFPTLIRVGKSPHDNCMTTGACFAPDGSRMVVSTYSSLYEWLLPKEKTLAEALQQAPVRIEPELLRQAEGVCYDSDSRTLWIISEHLPTPLLRVTR